MSQQSLPNDPFAYTGGSLLTPWTGKFEWNGGTAGAYTPPESKPFQFGAFNFQAPNFGRMTAPADFSYKDFVAPDAETFKQDPGYAFRMSEANRAAENSAAARGNLLSGAFMTALQDRNQAAASQEYGNAFNRAAQTYSMNRGNAAENYDRNFNKNLNTFNANVGAASAEGSLGLQGATAAWDRNYNLARTQWQDSENAAQAAASAGAANSARSYNQALGEYEMSRDEFWKNQDRQYSMLMGAANMGMGAAGQVGAFGSNYAGNAGNIYGQAANAQAAGQIGAGNAWMSGLSSAGNNALGAYYANQYGGNGLTARRGTLDLGGYY